MGSDAYLKLLFGDRNVFSSVANYAMRRRKKRIDPKQLRDCSTEEQLVLEKEVRTQFRDLAQYVCAKDDGHTIFMLVAMEFQTEVDYHMPLRVMKSDASRYDAQARRIAQQHRDSGENAHHKGGEFLYAFYKTDKLKPVITIVIYLSSEKWDGPTCLHQMFAVDEPELLEYIPDYKFILVQPADMSEEELGKMSTRAELFMGVMKHSSSKEQMLEYMEKKKEFQSLDSIEAYAISSCTELKVKIKEEGGTVNMCNAVREIIDDSKEEGRKEGRKEGRLAGLAEGEKKGKREGKVEGIFETRLEMIRKLEKSFKWTLEEAMEFLGIPAAERDAYYEALARVEG